MLQSLGYGNVAVAENGVEVLQLLEKDSYDVILMVPLALLLILLLTN